MILQLASVRWRLWTQQTPTGWSESLPCNKPPQCPHLNFACLYLVLQLGVRVGLLGMLVVLRTMTHSQNCVRCMRCVQSGLLGLVVVVVVVAGHANSLTAQL